MSNVTLPPAEITDVCGISVSAALNDESWSNTGG